MSWRVFFLIVLAGCSGRLADLPAGGEGGGGDRRGQGPGEAGGPVEGGSSPSNGGGLRRLLSAPERCSDGLPPPSVRRLSARQYRNSLSALFGDDPSLPEADVLDDPVVHGFRIDADTAVVRDLGAQRVMQHAEKVAAWAARSKLGLFSECRDTGASCRGQFIETFGARAFREPLSAAQRDAYDALFRAEPSFEAGAEAVMAAMLQSPFFLYRRELGAPEGGRHRLGAFEVASALSYLITDRPPDDALFAAARDGRLNGEGDLRRELERLLGTPHARETLARFVHGWLEVDDLASKVKDDTVTPLSPALRASMLEETAEFYVDLVRSGGSFADLLSARYSVIDPALAAFYGLSASGRVELDGTRRAPGVLGHASVLARHSLARNTSPVARGKLVRERLLCQALPPPPAGVNTDLATVDGDAPTRQRYAAHAASPACNSCHQLIDPVGFAFEHFDAFGRYREDDFGQPVDASGVLEGLPAGGDLQLDGLTGLADHLAQDPDARDCYARHVAYFAYGVPGCQASVEAAARAAEGSLVDALAALVTAPQFRERRPE